MSKAQIARSRFMRLLTAQYSPVQYSPADDAAGVQIKDHSQIEPALTGPDVAYVASPLLIGAVS